MSGRVIPARPDLEQYKKQAKALVKDRAAAVPEALERIHHRHPRFQGLPVLDIQRAPFKLSDAQLTIAREHDFETWSKFAAHIQTVDPANSKTSSGEAGLVQVSERIPVGGIELEAVVTEAENAQGVVLLSTASGASRYHPSYRCIAQELQRGSLCTVLTDLLTEEEDLAAITDWMAEHPRLKDLAMGYFATSDAATPALLAAGERQNLVRAVVSIAGAPALAKPWLWRVQAPTLLVVGSKDTLALGFAQSIMAPLPHKTDRKLAVIEGAHHMFDEQDALHKTAALARDWFRRYLAL
jgi:putative phosphoribosyl transferase